MLLAATSLAGASAFTDVIVYGDSGSDNGNLYGLIGKPQSPPYWKGRASNGPVAVEQLTTDLGLSQTHLHDFAWGGATTGVGNIQDGGTQTTMGNLGLAGMLSQASGSLGSITPIAPTSLFVVWGGTNDFRQLPPGSGTPAIAVSDILTIVAELQGVGAKQILVPGMADLSLTPAYYGDPAAQAFSQAFNSLLLANLPAGVSYFDMYDFMHAVVADPAAYGLINVTDPCLVGNNACPNPDQYLFWDGLHPTTSTYAILAVQLENAAVPEPSTLIMLSTGIAGLAGVLRKRIFS
jgi:phospholipase/lecithinase/hemolysin